MATHVVSRAGEVRAVADFLAAAAIKPAALVLRGEAGIGKTTVWLAALQQAREAGFQVLSARASSADSVLTYGALAALLDGVDDDALAGLPSPQRLAIDRVLSRATPRGPVSDQRAVAAAFVAVTEYLAQRRPVLLAIDDLQWIDQPSRLIVSSAVRRVVGPIGFLATVRTDPQAEADPDLLRLQEPDELRNIVLPPLSPGALHAVISQRLGRSFARPRLLRIHQVSGGNPFYALELARAMGDGARDPSILPRSLTELVRARLANLAEDVQQALLAVACLAQPTIEMASRACGVDTDAIVAALDSAVDDGIIEISGGRVAFTHPILAHGVYSAVAAGRRRGMHQRLAALVEEQELKARHLALAAERGDEQTLRALDEAAGTLRIRGAPAGAAELLDMAIDLGGDTPQRQLLSASYHFNSGDAGRARTILERVIAGSGPSQLKAEALRLLGLWSLLDGSSREAAELLTAALEHVGDDDALRAGILIPLAFAEVNARHPADAARSADEAVSAAENVDRHQVLSQALSMQALVHFLLGDGLDEQVLARALEVEDTASPLPALLSPSIHNAEILSATGNLDEARTRFERIRRGYLERGEESELMILAFHSGLNEIWRADFTSAKATSEDAMERAVQLDRDLPLSVALMLRAAVAAYAGLEDDARQDAKEAAEICRRCDSPDLVTVWPDTILGFLDFSLGHYAAALDTLKPWLAEVRRRPSATEIFIAPFLPDAIESLIRLALFAEAGELLEIFESNGRRLDRPWMLATGARCRALLHAAQGDLETANVVAEQALVEHARLPMPFELARTQLVHGQLQRRQRHRESGSATMKDALATFERLGTHVWTDRARAELARASGTRTRAELTASERRVAELAITGITNREMAAALFISPKTVEANLARVYRKLNIRSRAELGRVMGESGP